MKSSLVRMPGNVAKGLSSGMTVTNDVVKSCLEKRYDLDSQGDITEFTVTEEKGIFERGVYKIRTFGQGEIVVKVFRKTRSEAIDYYENIKNTHLAWQQDSSLGQYILKVQLKSKKPDYDETYGLLFMELAYDFILFDFCDELLRRGQEGIRQFDQFIKKDAAGRKEIMENNGRRQNTSKNNRSTITIQPIAVRYLK